MRKTLNNDNTTKDTFMLNFYVPLIVSPNNKPPNQEHHRFENI